MKPTMWRDAIRESRLDRTAKFVALMLSTYMNGAGYCYPSKELIAERCGFSSVRTVDSAIARLEREGFLHIERSRGFKSNRYVAMTPDNPATDCGVSGDENPATGQREPRNWTTNTPHGVAPEVEVLKSKDESVTSTRARARGKGNARRGRASKITEQDWEGVEAYDR